MAPPFPEVRGTSTGQDADLTLPGNGRVALHISPAMPAGDAFDLRIVDAGTLPSPPRARVDDLAFRLDVVDPSGATVSVLPAGARLRVTYADGDVAGRSEQGITLSWLDPSSGQWSTVSSAIVDPVANVVEAAVVNAGSYVVTAP